MHARSVGGIISHVGAIGRATDSHRVGYRCGGGDHSTAHGIASIQIGRGKVVGQLVYTRTLRRHIHVGGRHGHGTEGRHGSRCGHIATWHCIRRHGPNSRHKGTCRWIDERTAGAHTSSSTTTSTSLHSHAPLALKSIHSIDRGRVHHATKVVAGAGREQGAERCTHPTRWVVDHQRLHGRQRCVLRRSSQGHGLTVVMHARCKGTRQLRAKWRRIAATAAIGIAHAKSHRTEWTWRVGKVIIEARKRQATNGMRVG